MSTFEETTSPCENEIESKFQMESHPLAYWLNRAEGIHFPIEIPSNVLFVTTELILLEQIVGKANAVILGQL